MATYSPVHNWLKPSSFIIVVFHALYLPAKLYQGQEICLKWESIKIPGIQLYLSGDFKLLRYVSVSAVEKNVDTYD